MLHPDNAQAHSILVAAQADTRLKFRAYMRSIISFIAAEADIDSRPSAEMTALPLGNGDT